MGNKFGKKIEPEQDIESIHSKHLEYEQWLESNIKDNSRRKYYEINGKRYYITYSDGKFKGIYNDLRYLLYDSIRLYDTSLQNKKKFLKKSI